MNIPEGYTLDSTTDYRHLGGELIHWYKSEPKIKGDYEVWNRLAVTFENDGVTVKSTHQRTFKNQRFLCINGPLQGQQHTAEYAESQGYAQYNRGSRYGYCGKSPKYPKCILVHF